MSEPLIVPAVNEISNVQETTENLSHGNIKTLIRSLTKDVIKYYFQIKKIQTSSNIDTIESIISEINGLSNKNEIIFDLNNVRTYSKNINEETFRQIARSNNINANSDRLIQYVVLDLYNKNPTEAQEAYTISYVKNQRSFSEFMGGERDQELIFDSTKKDQLIQTLKDYIAQEDSSKKCIVNVKQVNQEIIMDAYIEENVKKIFAIESEQITIQIIKPASRNTAIYDIENNRLKVSCRNSDKLRKSLSGCFGSALFHNNDFFSIGKNAVSAYSLSSIEENGVTLLELDEVTVPKVKSVKITEETLEFNVGDDVVTATFCSDDVESILLQMSTDQINLTSAHRKSARIKFKIEIEENKEKEFDVFISGKNHIKYDEKYSEYIHFYLRKWGMENVDTRIRD